MLSQKQLLFLSEILALTSFMMPSKHRHLYACECNNYELIERRKRTKAILARMLQPISDPF